MEIKFKNKITLTQDLFYEFAKAMLKKYTLLMYGAGVFLLISSMILFLQEHFTGFIVTLIFGIFSLLIYPRVLFRTAKRSYRQQLLCYDGRDIEKTTEFTERIHIVSSNKAETFFDYPQITQICETKNLLILKISHSLSIILDKEGFASGGLASFRTFIQQKCLHSNYVVYKKIGKTRTPVPAAPASVHPDQQAGNHRSPAPIYPGTPDEHSVFPPPLQTHAGEEPHGHTAAVLKNTSPVMRVIMILLFVLSFTSIFIALLLISSHQSFSMSPTENSWMFFLPLPIPLANLILGILCKHRGMKTTKNIVVGIIFTFFLCVFGSFSFLNLTDTYSHNMSYLDTVASKIHFSLPDKGKIATQNFQPDRQKNSSGTSSLSETDAFDYYSMSNITFTDAKQLTDFEASLHGSSFWATSIATPTAGIVPEFYSLQTTNAQGFDYFMIYNADLGTYNALPDQSGIYRFIYLAYGSKEKKMFIGEYSCKVTLKNSPR